MVSDPSKEIDATSVLVIASAVFVLLMTIPGLALFYGSLVSRKNLLDTMLQSVMLCASIPIIWWLCAYSLSFDNGNMFFGGFRKCFLFWKPDAIYADIPEAAWCVFQMTFGIITAAIAMGSVVERSLLWPLMVLANLWFLLVYCPICHMVWGGGLLMEWGVVDTAGGLVVETCSGVTALVLCIFIGPRSVEPEPPETARAVLHIIGASLLWVGWLVFNGGSAYTSGHRASVTVLNTLLAGGAGAISWHALEWKFSKGGLRHSQSVFHLMGGAVAGLVAATPSSGFVDPTGSVIIGCTAGLISCLADLAAHHRPLGIDDVVSVFPVHGMAGIWGTFMTGVLAVEEVGGVKGAIQGNWSLVGIQSLGILVTVAWSAAGTAILAGAFAAVKCLRATKEQEEAGMDSVHHGQRPSSKHITRAVSCQDEESWEDGYGTDATNSD